MMHSKPVESTSSASSTMSKDNKNSQDRDDHDDRDEHHEHDGYDGYDHRKKHEYEYFQSRALRHAVSTGDLADITRLNYETRINALQDATGLSIKTLLRQPAETYAAIVRKSNGVPQTVRSYLTAVLALFRHSNNLRELRPNECQEFKEYFRQVDQVVQQRYNSNIPTERQRDAYMPWSEVLKRRDSIITGASHPAADARQRHVDHLVLCLYTMIPPLRADFGNVRIMSTSGARSKEGNMLIVTDADMRLILNEFKSKSKRMQQYNKVLPKDLDAVIRASLARYPRTHLLVSPRDDLPFLRDNTYVVFVHRILERVLGKKVSISMLRHIYVNSLDFNALTSGQKCQLSADMLHSVSTNDRYRLIF